jgi:hypothetical protein
MLTPVAKEILRECNVLVSTWAAKYQYVHLDLDAVLKPMMDVLNMSLMTFKMVDDKKQCIKIPKSLFVRLPETLRFVQLPELPIISFLDEPDTLARVHQLSAYNIDHQTIPFAWCIITARALLQIQRNNVNGAFEILKRLCELLE